jgi:hypothetical protein
MTPIARLTNPAKIIAIAKFLMFFMPYHLLFLLLDLLHTTKNTKTMALQRGPLPLWRLYKGNFGKILLI